MPGPDRGTSFGWPRGVWLRAWLASGLAAGLLVGCGDAGGARGWTGTVEPLPGGGRRVSNPAEGVWESGGEPGWRLEEELRIGAVDGEGADVFGRISGLAVDPWDRIHVVEAQAREIRVFGPEGVAVRVIGRAGEGPGEFRNVGMVAWDPAGMMWVQDPMNARYTRFDSAGILQETRPRETRAMVYGPHMGGMTGTGVMYDVDLAGEGEADVPPLMAAAGIGSVGRNVLRAMFATSGETVADTADLPADDTEVVVFRTERSMLGAPFAPRLYWVFEPTGHIWFGTSEAYRIVKRSLAGDTALVIERTYTPLAVESADVDAWLETPGPVRFREGGGRIDRDRIPTVKPVFDRLLVDDRSVLWVGLVQGRDQPTRFDVFDAEGRYLGAVTAPQVLQAPLVRGDRLYAVVTDSLDVPYVVRYRIVGRNDGS